MEERHYERVVLRVLPPSKIRVGNAEGEGLQEALSWPQKERMANHHHDNLKDTGSNNVTSPFHRAYGRVLFRESLHHLGAKCDEVYFQASGILGKEKTKKNIILKMALGAHQQTLRCMYVLSLTKCFTTTLVTPFKLQDISNHL